MTKEATAKKNVLKLQLQKYKIGFNKYKKTCITTTKVVPEHIWNNFCSSRAHMGLNLTFQLF